MQARARVLLAFAGLCVHDVASQNSVTHAPSATETRELWETRVKELSRMVTSNEVAKAAFEEFSADKDYARGELVGAGDHQQEKTRRFEIFRNNVKKALELNIKSDGQAVFGITRFMDLSEHEFRKYYKNGGQRFTDDEITEILADVPEYKIEGGAAAGTSRDWRDEGVVTPIKDQGQCGSCWAFSTVESVESAARLVDPKTDFIGAPQELVSCDHNFDLGCNGGLPTRAYSFLKTHGLETEADYPYTSGAAGNSGRCKMDESKGKWKVTSYTRVAHGIRWLPWTVSRGEENMKDYMLKHGPMSIGVDASSWQTYQQGVISAELCSPTSIDHAVQVVAISQDSNQVGAMGNYWTVRNSWTDGWGEKGYVRLSVGENTCLITGMATVPTVEKTEATKSTTMMRPEEMELHI